MLEDCQVMEKKPNGRSVQPPAKGGGTENKKAQDTTNKPFGKYTRRREPSGYNNPKNSDGLRKPPNPPKNGKYTDKRPRPRSQNYSCGKTDTKVAEEEGPEYGSVFVAGSKKQNLNHLLNFHYAPRDIVSGNGGQDRVRISQQNWLATHKHKYNKEHFLQANCQFVVKSDADYSMNLANPDLLVDWTAIEQIRLQSAETVSCPICLDTPVAAKMTRCGHVYCWPCILHYLALSDKTWRKCPICYEAVHRGDLKSVVTRPLTSYPVGAEMTLRLMKRERGSLMTLPACLADRQLAAGPLSVAETGVDTVYSKLLLATPQHVADMVGGERAELETQLRESQGCPELCFVEQALQLLAEREARLKDAAGSVDCATQLPCEDSLAAEAEALSLDDETTRRRFESVSSEGAEAGEGGEPGEAGEAGEGGASSGDDLPNIVAEDLEIGGQPQGCTKPYYFYQAADGQHAYLHALNIKMLVMEYNSLDRCPVEIRGRIVEKESGSMTDELRRRLRYLQHLPLTTQFDVLELDLAGLVSCEVLGAFHEQLDVRAKRRNRRAREERRRERKINDEVNLQWGRHPAAKIRIESHHHFPSCGLPSDQDQGAVAAPQPSPPSSVVSRSQSLSSLCSGPVGQLDDPLELQEVQPGPEPTGPSFAQMLRDGPGPGRASGPRGRARPSLSAAEWPAPQPAEPEVDGWAAAPLYRQSFSDAIAVALERAEQAQDEEPAMAMKKRKKKKQKVLFVTGMACSTK